MKTLNHVIAHTVRRFAGPEGMERLADTLGIGASMLYRISNPCDEGAHLSTRHLVPLMKATGDASILGHLASRMGYLLYRLPRVRTAREGEIARLQESQAKAIQMVLGFYAKTQNAEETMDALQAEIRQAAGFLKAVSEHPQPALFEEGDEP